MFRTWLNVFVLIFCVLLVTVGGLWTDEEIEGSVTTRNSKFFPFFLGPTVVRISHTSCTGENGLVGTCLTANECTSSGGKASGTCSRGFGRCCVVQKTCGMSTKSNCTYFTSPGYPVPYNDGGICKLTIWRCASDVCQLRLDFLDFNLAQPDFNGNCVNDFMVVTGGASNVPKICGVNTGEHVYIDFDNGSPITIMIDTSSTATLNRQWKIKITQIKCCDRAPVGCLMYYKGTSGKVMSFNYGVTPSMVTDPSVFGPGTREMANLNYGVCVEMAPGYCSIEWSQNPNDPYSFTVSNTTNILDDTVLGTPAGSVTGEACTGDFIVIPAPMQGGTNLPYDRFCGNGLPTITSASKPFVMTVVTNDTEISAQPDTANRGFCLNFRQQPCA